MLEINQSYPCKVGYYGSKRNTSKIKYIVLHYTGNDKDTALANAKYFHTSINRQASAHYFVDETSVYQSVQDNYVAWSVGGGIMSSHHPLYKICTNSNSISIEMCTSGNSEISETTENNAIELVKYLMKKYGIDANNVIRHYDVNGKSCPSTSFRTGDRWSKFIAKLGGTVQEATNVSSNTLSQTTSNSNDLIKIGQQHTINYTGHSITVDGIYGKNTKANIIRCFQKAMNSDYHKSLTIDGICGKNTINALGNHYVKQGERQEMVRAVQVALYCHGYNPNGTDAIFGNGTKQAVIQFQKAKGLTVDGVAGKNTIMALMGV